MDFVLYYSLLFSFIWYVSTTKEISINRNNNEPMKEMFPDSLKTLGLFSDLWADFNVP